ncbi:methyltransferase domain-containing protein [Geminocystis sp. CENA526]|uniref:methyltransferase domain-containing protein n=1 Tax=Geminocystis sp. CENA526 TaxID=1355871 RepID=UPI003D6DD2A7
MSRKIEKIKLALEKNLCQLRNITKINSDRRECPLCGWKGFSFLPHGYGITYRKDALCPQCHSLERHRAMKKMDLTSLTLPDSSQTLIFCSHVLEHIPNDIMAMKEMFRVLKPKGVSIIQVPIWREKSYEDFSITSKKKKLEIFFNQDHVRLYGLDIVERLESVGFSVFIKTIDSFSDDTIKKYSLSFQSTKEVFFCYKSK